MAASSSSSSTSIGTTAVETILKIPVVTPQISASATIVPGTARRDHQRPGCGRQQLAGRQAAARRHAVEQMTEHRAEHDGGQVLGDARSPRRRPGRRSGRGCAAAARRRRPRCPRFVTARASQNEKKRQPGGPITARRSGRERAATSPIHRTPRRGRPALVERRCNRDRAARHDILARDERDPRWRAAHARRGRARRARRRARRGGGGRARARAGRARRGRARRGALRRRLRRHHRRRRAQARERRRRRDGRLQPPPAARSPHGDAGPDAPREVVRAAMVRLANGFAKGTSGVRTELLGARRRRAQRRRDAARAHCSARRARAISARWPTSPTASAATCPWPPRRASR